MKGPSAIAAFNCDNYAGRSFNAFFIDHDEKLLQITISGHPHLPVYFSNDDDQLLLFSYLFCEEDVIEEDIEEINEQLLQLSISLPLCAVGKIGRRYVVFGYCAESASDTVLLEQAISIAESTEKMRDSFQASLRRPAMANRTQ